MEGTGAGLDGLSDRADLKACPLVKRRVRSVSMALAMAALTAGETCGLSCAAGVTGPALRIRISTLSGGAWPVTRV